MRYRNNNFDELFEHDLDSALEYNKYLSFFYFLPSPRKNVKVGITSLPWQRLRQYQQGTDEELAFTKLWMLESPSRYSTLALENQIKFRLKDKSLHRISKRGGHTEWFKNLTSKHYETLLKNEIEARSNNFCLKVVPIIKPYTATRPSLCPLNSPSDPNRWDIRVWKIAYWNSI